MMPVEQLVELRALARKATPGRWFVTGSVGSRPWDIEVRAKACAIAVMKTLPIGGAQGESKKEARERDAAFIAAARPEVVLELLDYIEELKKNFSDDFLKMIDGLCRRSLMKEQADLEKDLSAAREINARLQAQITSLMLDIERLEKERDWLCAAQNFDVPADEPTRYPSGREPAGNCAGFATCEDCWRNAAQTVVENGWGTKP